MLSRCTWLQESGGAPGVFLRERLAGAGAVLVRGVCVLLTRNRGEPERARPLAGDRGILLAVVDPGREPVAGAHQASGARALEGGLGLGRRDALAAHAHHANHEAGRRVPPVARGHALEDAPVLADAVAALQSLKREVPAPDGDARVAGPLARVHAVRVARTRCCKLLGARSLEQFGGWLLLGVGGRLRGALPGGASAQAASAMNSTTARFLRECTGPRRRRGAPLRNAPRARPSRARRRSSLPCGARRARRLARRGSEREHLGVVGQPAAAAHRPPEERVAGIEPRRSNGPRGGRQRRGLRARRRGWNSTRPWLTHRAAHEDDAGAVGDVLRHARCLRGRRPRFACHSERNRRCCCEHEVRSEWPWSLVHLGSCCRSTRALEHAACRR